MRQISIATLLTLALSLFSATAIRADERQPIARLMMRDRVIEIVSHPSGVLYSVSTKDGTVLDANINEAQLQAKYPDVYEKVRPAIADSKQTPDVIPWAGMFPD